MLTLILAASTFTFAGGSAAELTQAISDATGQPVVVAYMGTGRIRAAQFPWADAAKFKDAAKTYFAFQATTGDALGFGPKTLPEWLLDPQVPTVIAQGGMLTVKDGKVDATPEKGKYLSGHAVEHIALSKPIRLHWLLADIPLAIAATAAPEKDFLAAVANALGAKLDDQGAYSIDPDPKLFRERVLGTYRVLGSKATSRSQAALYQLDSDFVASVRDADVPALFATPNGGQTVSAWPGSTLFSSAWRYAQTYVAEQQAPDRQASQARSMVDPQQPVQLTYGPRQGVSLTFLGADGRVRYRLPEIQTQPAMMGGPINPPAGGMSGR